MKKIFWISCALIMGVMAFFNSCSKSIKERTENIAALDPQNEDENAGDWKTCVLTAPDEVQVNAPAATTTPDYIAQVNEIKAWQKNMSAEDKRNIEYWGAGGILRWNEILRALVAKRNLPPYQNDDGTYPAPSASNPLAYPIFPFANPPYAARAYAYASMAQYDALVAAWHYKKLYNRPSPSKVDSTLKVLVNKSELSSYPSTEGAIIGSVVEVLKLMFPADQDFIQKKAEEHRRAAIMSGANVRSDLDAGEALGKAIAQKLVARARLDKAGQAGGNPAHWASLEDTATKHGETPWYSLEVPRRPPMLPLFGRVSPCLFDSATTVALRPGPPPSVHSEQMKKETEEIYEFIKNPSREHIRIVHFWADGVGTATPPGHWDAIAAEDFIKKDYSEVRWARNMALLNMAMMDAAIVCWDTKFHYFNPRPTQLNSSIKTLTGIPNFPAYISGHSTFSGAAAAILGHLVPERAGAYDAMAQEASLSRMYGGIHYRSDCEIGLEVGKNVGLKAIERATTDGAE